MVYFNGDVEYCVDNWIHQLDLEGAESPSLC